MIKKLKGKIGDFVRGFEGLYHNNTDKYLTVPEGLKEIIIGHSTEGRDIFAYKFGNNGHVKVLFMGGIHGNEVGTVKLMYKLINYLSRNKKDYLGLELFVVPCVNPDGLAKALQAPDYFGGGRNGRFNANNVDLNRNFKTSNFCSENFWFFGNKDIPVFCGTKPFSEPESLAIADFIKTNRISVLYSFHSRGKEVMGNLNKLSQELVKDFVNKTGYRYVSHEEWKKMKQTGTVKEWCEDNNIAYVEVESSVRYGSDWKKQKDAIIGAIRYYYG